MCIQYSCVDMLMLLFRIVNAQAWGPYVSGRYIAILLKLIIFLFYNPAQITLYTLPGLLTGGFRLAFALLMS